jgi:ATP-binding cassette subfamily B protein
LLQRFYDPISGSILFNGINICDLELEALRKMIGVVPQDIVIFSDNAMENIRFGRMDATDEEVFAAARLAIADEFISKLPEGYQSFLGDRGIRLSGGQKQRVAIARALINDPLLIMGDEPTGNLDKKNSAIVFDIFKELASTYKQTLLIVTHDNEFAANTHRIIEMEDGKIIN